METISPLCANCQTEMVLREKQGEKFWGCPNWRECKGKTIPFRPTQSKEPIKEIRTIPILRLDLKDKEELLKPLREIWKQNEEIKQRLDNLEKKSAIYPKDENVR